MSDEKPYVPTGMEVKWEEWVLETTNFLNTLQIPVYKPGTKKAMTISERLPFLLDKIRDQTTKISFLRHDLEKEQAEHVRTRKEYENFIEGVKEAETLLTTILEGKYTAPKGDPDASS